MSFWGRSRADRRRPGFARQDEVSPVLAAARATETVVLSRASELALAATQRGAGRKRAGEGRTNGSTDGGCLATSFLWPNSGCPRMAGSQVSTEAWSYGRGQVRITAASNASRTLRRRFWSSAIRRADSSGFAAAVRVSSRRPSSIR